MINNIDKLLQIISSNNFISIYDDNDYFILSFIYIDCNKYTFIDKIISIISTFPPSLNEILSINNLPPLKKPFSDIDDLKEKLSDHLAKHIRMKTNNIEYKISLKKSLLITTENYNINYFWNLSNFTSILINPFENIDEIGSLFSTSYYNIIIIINEKNILFYNSNTLIVSSDKFPKSLTFPNVNIENLNQKIEFRSHHCNIEFPLYNIVPDFFIFDFSNLNFSFPKELKLLLNNLFAIFYILYICNSAKINNGKLIVTIFANKNISINYNTTLKLEEINNLSSLLELYYLCYNSLNIENLYIVRNMYVIYLDINSREDLSLLFFAESKKVLDSAKANLNILTIGNVEKYFSVRYSLYEFLDKNMLDIQNKISNLIKNINKTLLSTIAALATTSFIYFRDRNITVLKLSILLYTVYLIINCTYLFIPQWSAFHVQQKQYKHKIDSFEPIIGSNEFNNILHDCENNKTLVSSFYEYFWTTFIFYVFLILLGVALFFFLNPLLNFLKSILN